MHTPLIEEATALLMLKEELGPLYEVQKQEVIQRYLDEVRTNATPLSIAVVTLKELVQMKFIDAQELSQLVSAIMKGSQSKDSPQQTAVPQPQNSNPSDSFLSEIGQEAADEQIVPPPKFDYYAKYKKDGSLVDAVPQKQDEQIPDQKTEPVVPSTTSAPSESSTPSTSTPTKVATFDSTPLPSQNPDNNPSNNNAEDVLQNRRVAFIYSKPEVPEFQVDAPKVNYFQLQRQEIMKLKQHFRSLMELESPKGPGTLCYEVQLVPFSGKDAKKNLVFVTCVVIYPSTYPYCPAQVTVTPIKGLTVLQCKRLQNVANHIAEKHIGYTNMMIVFREIKRWMSDVNNRMLAPQDRVGIWKDTRAIYYDSVDLDIFELEGRQLLLNTVATSIINFKSFQNFWERWEAIELYRQIEWTVYGDPEFLLKLAYYVRHHLNIRSTANLLANYTVCHYWFPKYFCSIIRLPSDLLEVVNLYLILPYRYIDNGGLPNVLRDSIKAKFKQFDEHQLGKYCSESRRKRDEKKAKKKKRLGLNDPFLERHFVKDMKALIHKVHITQPRQHVMAILGCKYPSTEEEFVKSKLPGTWDPNQKGKRMKLKQPVTWETQIGIMGNKAEMWQFLLKENKLPYMAMIRNLRNILKCGLSPNYHQLVCDKISNEEAVAKCRQFPTTFLSAYNAVNIDLSVLARVAKYAKVANKKARQRRKREKDMNLRWGVQNADQREHKREKRFREKLKTKLQVKQIVIPRKLPSPKILRDYQNAVDTALKVSARRNLPELKGKSVILIDVSGSMNVPITYKFLSYTSKTEPTTRLEVAILLGLMIYWASIKPCDLYIFADTAIKVKVDKDRGILWNVGEMKKVAAKLHPWSTNFPWESIYAMSSNQQKYDRMVLLSDMLITSGSLLVATYMRAYTSPLVEAIAKYRNQVNKDFKFVMIDVTGTGKTLTDQDERTKDPRDVFISGFSDQILRFLQCQEDTQMSVVDNIDQELKQHNDNNNNA